MFGTSPNAFCTPAVRTEEEKESETQRTVRNTFTDTMGYRNIQTQLHQADRGQVQSHPGHGPSLSAGAGMCVRVWLSLWVWWGAALCGSVSVCMCTCSTQCLRKDRGDSWRFSVHECALESGKVRPHIPTLSTHTWRWSPSQVIISARSVSAACHVNTRLRIHISRLWWPPGVWTSCYLVYLQSQCGHLRVRSTRWAQCGWALETSKNCRTLPDTDVAKQQKSRTTSRALRPLFVGLLMFIVFPALRICCSVRVLLHLLCGEATVWRTVPFPCLLVPQRAVGDPTRPNLLRIPNSSHLAASTARGVDTDSSVHVAVLWPRTVITSLILVYLFPSWHPHLLRQQVTRFLLSAHLLLSFHISSCDIWFPWGSLRSAQECAVLSLPLFCESNSRARDIQHKSLTVSPRSQIRWSPIQPLLHVAKQARYTLPSYSVWSHSWSVHAKDLVLPPTAFSKNKGGPTLLPRAAVSQHRHCTE